MNGTLAFALRTDGCWARREASRFAFRSAKVALVAAHHAGPALDLYEVDPGRSDREQINLIDRPVRSDELEEGKRTVGIVIGELLAHVVECLPLPGVLRRGDLYPPTGAGLNRRPGYCGVPQRKSH